MDIFKHVNKVVSRWNATDVYLITGLVVGFVIWLVMGVFLMKLVLKVVGL